MSYKEKFQASQDKAHHQAIATKILSHMSELRSLADESTIAPRRWIWELIQNAKDVSINGKVKIKVHHSSSSNEEVIFKHTGKPFTADDIRFLIEQISTKDRKKDDEGKRKTTGKFGTGFLTTHLLSEKVKIKAVAKEPELDYRIFELELDRSGDEPDDITKSVANSKEAVADLDDLDSYNDYKPGAYSTRFTYELIDQTGRTVARKGLEDLAAYLAFVLVFVEEIESVEIVHDDLVYQIQENTQNLSDEIDLHTISITNKRIPSESFHQRVVTLSDDYTTIAIPVVRSDEGQISIESIADSTPTLFCDFPLIGTEIFPFPVIINNPHFNPTDPRDGVFLTDSDRSKIKSDQNKSYILDAISLYFSLLEFAAKEDWKNLHLLAEVSSIREHSKWISDSWYNREVLKPIREKLLYAKIVRPASSGKPESILSADGTNYMWFPNSFKKVVREKIWDLAKDWFPHCIPNREDIEIWYRLSWDDCGKLTLDQLSEFIEGLATLEELEKKIKDRDIMEWLNSFYEALKLEEKNYNTVINKRLIFLNQNGILCKNGNLWRESDDVDDSFKDILMLLGNDIREELIDPALMMEIDDEKVRDRAYVVKEITSAALQYTGTTDIGTEIREAFNKLLVWFKNNPESAKSLFPELYRRKHILYDEEVIADSMEKAEQLADLMEEFGANDLGQLRSLLEDQKEGNTGLLSITQDILTSMGITSIEEWEDALKDEDLAALFAHTSTPSTDMFVYAQSMIAKAKENIVTHLRGLAQYDLSEMDLDTAPTIIAGVVKNGLDISIVGRPAYNGEVIIYYGSEKDVLDYENSELWADTGRECKQVTLGHILKKAQIKKFPI